MFWLCTTTTTSQLPTTLVPFSMSRKDRKTDRLSYDPSETKVLTSTLIRSEVEVKLSEVFFKALFALTVLEELLFKCSIFTSFHLFDCWHWIIYYMWCFWDELLLTWSTCLLAGGITENPGANGRLQHQNGSAAPRGKAGGVSVIDLGGDNKKSLSESVMSGGLCTDLARRTCNKKQLEKKLPIIGWLPK